MIIWVRSFMTVCMYDSKSCMDEYFLFYSYITRIYGKAVIAQLLSFALALKVVLCVTSDIKNVQFNGLVRCIKTYTYILRHNLFC